MTIAIVVLVLLLLAAGGVIAYLVGQLARAGTVPATPPVATNSVVEATDGSLPRLVAALDALSLGVVVADADEVLGFQNRSAQAILSSRDARSIINRAVRELL